MPWANAGTGAAVLTPEIPEWTALRIDPERSVPTIQAAVLTLSERAETAADRTGLIGFSFGAPQALIASTDPALQGRLRLVVGFGGYCDLRRLLRFMFTGEHEWDGVWHTHRPDPYGRWVVGGDGRRRRHRDSGQQDQHLYGYRSWRSHGLGSRGALFEGDSAWWDSTESRCARLVETERGALVDVDRDGDADLVAQA